MNEIAAAQAIPGGYAVTLSDGCVATVPAAPGNRHYDEIVRRAALPADDPDHLAVSEAE